jgi:hypothetical protein
MSTPPNSGSNEGPESVGEAEGPNSGSNSGSESVAESEGTNYGFYEGPESVGQAEPNPVLDYRMEPITQEEHERMSDEEKRVEIIKRANFFYLRHPRVGPLCDPKYKKVVNHRLSHDVEGSRTIDEIVEAFK